jgi:protocatechuate 3,4-dioxygenase beta subunit
MAMLALAIFGLSPSTIVESTFAQDIDTTTPSGLPASLPPPLPFSQLSAEQIAASTNKTCTLTPSLIEVEGTPQQTQGPYFVDDIPNRSDIRSDTSDSSVQGGVPLNLTINVYDVDDNDGTCTPLKDAQVDIWQANSQGVYSDVTELGTGGRDFLRGYQVTDDNGTVRFATVYPGWYEGRAIHIHVKVRLLEELENLFEWTSQFYLNNSINELIHKQPPYSDHGPVNMLNEEDGIYAGPSTDGLVQTNAGNHLMLNLTQDQQRNYIGNFNIGVNATTQ